jgi:hypothetical protein
MKINQNMINSLYGQINNTDKKIFKKNQNNEESLLYVKITIKHNLESFLKNSHIK